MRCITAEVTDGLYLRWLHDSGARVVQKDKEDRATLANRVSKASRLCRNIFTKGKVVNSYIQGLKRSVRESIRAAVRPMTEADRRILAVVRKAGISQGKE